MCVLDGDRAVATATGWHGSLEGYEVRGRLHFVAVHPEYQGRGLARVVVSGALARLRAAGFTSAYLTSQTTSARAIALYRRLGFAPCVRAACRHEDTRGWRLMEAVLREPCLPTVRPPES